MWCDSNREQGGGDENVAGNGLRESPAAQFLLALYRFPWLRALSVKLARRFEGEFYSTTLRHILSRYHGVRVGAYSYGPCLDPGAFPAGAVVGRYVSIASGVRILNRNHPTDRLSTHPFFFNKALGYVPADNIPSVSLEIAHDAWIGANVLVTSGCSRIGIGAVVGAGAIVTKDVPDYAIAVGNPAKIIKYRFPQNIQVAMLASRWWERSIEDLSDFLPDLVRPVGDEPWTHPLLIKQ